MTWCLFLGLLAAPRLFSSGLCSLFPWAGFSKRGTHPRWCWRGPIRAGGGGAPEAEPGGGRFVYQRRHYVISERLVPGPALQAPRPVTLPGAERGVENREADGKEKLEVQVFPLGHSCKMCWDSKLPVLFSWPPKKNELPCFCLSPIPVWMGEAGESCCQPWVPSFPLRDSISQTIQKVWASRLQCLGWGHIQLGNGFSHSLLEGLRKLTEPSLLYPFSVMKKTSDQRKYTDNRSHPFTTGSHWFPKDKSWLYFSSTSSSAFLLFESLISKIDVPFLITWVLRDFLLALSFSSYASFPLYSFL